LFKFLVENTAAFQSWAFRSMQEKDRQFHIDEGIDRLACEPPSTILMASFLGLVDVVNALLRAKLRYPWKLSGHSPLFLACERGHAEVASILIQNIVRDDSGVFEDNSLCVAIKKYSVSADQWSRPSASYFLHAQRNSA